MEIIKFEECNCTFAENQPEYLPLPAHKSKDGIVTSCWGLSLRQRLRLLFSGRMFLQIMTFNKPLQPLKITINKPDLTDEAPTTEKAPFCNECQAYHTLETPCVSTVGRRAQAVLHGGASKGRKGHKCSEQF